MSEEERKQLAYIVGMLLKIARGEELDGNELQSLENMRDDLGFYEIEEDYFRF